MKKHFAILLAAMTMTGFASMAVAAGNPILTSLESKGLAAQKLDTAALDKVRGTGCGGCVHNYYVPVPVKVVNVQPVLSHHGDLHW